MSMKVMNMKAFAKKSFLESRRPVSRGDRDLTIGQALIDVEKPDMKLLSHLSHVLSEEAQSAKFGGTDVLYYALALKEWLLIREQSMSSRDIKLSPSSMLTMAKAHLDLWSRQGVAADAYHLSRSRDLFESAFAQNSELRDATALYGYCKILTLLGCMEEASNVIMNILTHFEQDGEYPNYLLFAGGIFKSMGQHDKANNYFFEASQVGPPKFFSKLEMMIIISRTIEEQQAGNEDDEGGSEDEDAYKMVHAHMVLEGHIDEGMEYEDWITSSSTWLALGDKCAFHGMYSLATDLYGLGIMKDMEAFKRPMLWLRFAKSCKRCGRWSDGQLAVKQALTYDPFNAQLLKTQKYWSSNPTEFSDMIKGDLVKILSGIPPEVDSDSLAIRRAQAVLKGVLERRALRLGVGTRRDVTKRMTARVGTMLDSGQPGGAPCPVFLLVRPAWSGLINTIRVFDIANNHVGNIPLRVPFAPMKETGVPRKLKLSLQVRRRVLKVRAGLEDGYDSQDESNKLEPWFKEERVTELTFKFTDLNTGEYTMRRMKLNLAATDVKPKSTQDVLSELMGGKSPTGVARAAAAAVAAAAGTYRPVSISATEYAKEEYAAAQRSSAPSALDSNKVPPQQDLRIDTVRKDNKATPKLFSQQSVVNRLTLEDCAPHSTAAGGAEAGGMTSFDRVGSASAPPSAASDADMAAGGTAAASMQPLGPAVVTTTNIEVSELLREGIWSPSGYFLVRVVNEADVTQVTMLQTHTDRVFVFLMARENIDRTLRLKKNLNDLLGILEGNPLVEPLLNGKTPLTLDEILACENPTYSNGKHCFVNMLPRHGGAAVILVDPNNMPMLGCAFEKYEDGDDERSEVSLASVKVAPPADSAVLPVVPLIPAAVVDQVDGPPSPLADSDIDNKELPDDLSKSALSEDDDGDAFGANAAADADAPPVLSPPSTKGLERPPAPLVRLQSSKSFRNLHTDNFLKGNLAPAPPVVDPHHHMHGQIHQPHPHLLSTAGEAGDDISVNSLGSQKSILSIHSQSSDTGEVNTMLQDLKSITSSTGVPPGGIASATSNDIPLTAKTPSPDNSAEIATKENTEILNEAADEKKTIQESVAKESAPQEETPATEILVPAPVVVQVSEPTVQPAISPSVVPNWHLKSVAISSMGSGKSLHAALRDAEDVQTGRVASPFHSLAGTPIGGGSSVDKVGQKPLLLPPVQKAPPAAALGAQQYLASGREEEFLQSLVDIFWIEELGSQEAVQYAVDDVIEDILDSTVRYLSRQVHKLTLIEDLVDECLQQGFENAVNILEERRMVKIKQRFENLCDTASNAAEENVLQEIVDGATNQAVNDEVVRRVKAAIAAEKAEEARLKAIEERHRMQEELQKRRKDLKQSNVTGTPYRAAAVEDPKDTEPVHYNVTKIKSQASGAYTAAASHRAHSKRNALVPVLHAPAMNRRISPRILTSSQEYRPPETMGVHSPLVPVYTGTFSLANMAQHATQDGSEADEGNGAGHEGAADAYNEEDDDSIMSISSAGSSQVLRLNYMADPIRVISPVSSSGDLKGMAATVVEEDERISTGNERELYVQNQHPLMQAEELVARLQEWEEQRLSADAAAAAAIEEDRGGGGGGRKKRMSNSAAASVGGQTATGRRHSLMSVTYVDEAHLQPFRSLERSASGKIPATAAAGASSAGTKDDGDGASLNSSTQGSIVPDMHDYVNNRKKQKRGKKKRAKLDMEDDNRTGEVRGTQPLFHTIQHRNLDLPKDENSSVFSAGSASRVGGRRAPNRHIMRDVTEDQQHAADANSVFSSIGDDGSGGWEEGSLLSQQQDSLSGTAAGFNSTTSTHSRQSAGGGGGGNVDPLQVPPRGRRAHVKKMVVKKSVDDYKYKGYVLQRPLLHATHWRQKLVDYLGNLRNANQLRKHVHMLTRAIGNASGQAVLTPEEAVCALADTSGNVGEVVERLKNLEFRSELMLVCRSIHVRSMACMLEGGDRIFKDSMEVGAADLDYEFAHSEQEKSLASTGKTQLNSLLHTRTLGVAPVALSKTMPIAPSVGSGHLSGKGFGSMKVQYHSVAESLKSATAPSDSSANASLASVSAEDAADAGGRVVNVPNRVVTFSPSPQRLSPIASTATLLDTGTTGDSAGGDVGAAAAAVVAVGGRGEGESEDDDASGITSLTYSISDDHVSHTSHNRHHQHGTSPKKLGAIKANSFGASHSSHAFNRSTGSMGSAGSAGESEPVATPTPGIRSMLSLPRMPSSLDVKVESSTVASRASFVPVKFKSHTQDLSPPRMHHHHHQHPPPAHAQHMPAHPPTYYQQQQQQQQQQRHHHQQSVPDPTAAGATAGSSHSPAAPLAPDAEAQMGMFTNWSNHSLVNVRVDPHNHGAAAVIKRRREEEEGAQELLEAAAEEAGGELRSSPSLQEMLRNTSGRELRMRSQSSFRMEGRIDELLQETTDAPVAIMCRHDYLKAQQDEVLLKSNKVYIREPIEKKIGRNHSNSQQPSIGEVEDDEPSLFDQMIDEELDVVY